MEFFELFEAMSLSTMISPLLISILILVENWMIFNKAGERGWKVLIPFYGEFVKCRIAKKKNLFWWKLVLSIILVVATFAIAIFSATTLANLNTSSPTEELAVKIIVLSLAILASAIGAIIAEVKLCTNLAKAFKLPAVFGVGLLFLEPVFAGIIAFSGKIQHVDVAKAKEDVIE